MNTVTITFTKKEHQYLCHALQSIPDYCSDEAWHEFLALRSKVVEAGRAQNEAQPKEA